MTDNVVIKSLAGAEDILRGVGPVSQTRNGQPYTINQVHAPVTLANLSSLASFNPASGAFVDVVTGAACTSYVYSDTDTTGITSLFGGSWIRQDITNSEPSYYNRLCDFTLGATIKDTNDALLNPADGNYYIWLGTRPKTVPPISTPESTGGIGPGAWFNVGKATLLARLNSPDGALEIGFKATSVYGRLSKDVFITDFVGGGEDSVDNLPALNEAKLVANGGRIIFPKRGTGVYKFPTGFPDFAGFIVSPDDGVVIECPATPNVAVSTIVTDNDYRVYFNAGDPHNYYIDIRANYKNAGSKTTNKSLWLNDGNVRDTKAVTVPADTIPVKQFALGVGDLFTNVTPAGRSASSLFVQPPSGGVSQVGAVAITPGEALSVGVNVVPTSGGELVAGVIFTTGYIMLRGYPTSGVWSVLTKYVGQAPSDITVTPDGGGTPTYSASNNILTVRCVSPIHVQVLINGVVAVNTQITSGAIQYACVGATSTGSVSGGNFTGWYKTKFKVASAPRSQTLGFIGDSITDPAVHGTWPQWCSEALDGSLGIRINGVENRAISGQTLDQQIANLAAHPFVNASVVAIFIGTNDIQGGNTLAAFQASLNSLITTLSSQGRTCVLVIPPQWYLASDAVGLPVNGTVNSNRGGDIRAAVGRIAAERGTQLVDLTNVTGPVNPGYFASSYTDAMLRDCIHPTAYGYRLYGYEVARAIAAQVCPAVELPSAWIPITDLAVGVTGTPKYRYTENGIELSGELNITTPANGIVGTLPLNIAPPVIRRFVQWGTNDFIKLAVNTTGTLEVVNSASTVMSLDNVHF